MITVNVHEAKTKLSQLLNEIETHHETIRICRNGKPIADIVPIQEIRDPLIQHKKYSKVKILCDLTQPLTDDEWPEDLK